MNVGTLEIELMANIARLQADMDRAQRTVGGAMADISKTVELAKKAMLGFAGVASASAFADMIKGSIEASAGMHDLSIQTGASVAALQALKSVAATSDTTIEGIAEAMGKLAKGMAGADEESKGVGAAIKALGLDFNRLQALSPDQQMLSIAKAMDEFADGAGKSAAAMTLFGKSGAQMLPFLKDLADESENVTAKLTDQQVAAKAAQAAMADDFTDNLTKIKKAGEKWKGDIATGMLPALFELSQAFLDVNNSAGGIKAQISGLSKDGSITEWSRMAVTGVTYAMDAFEGFWRVLKALGKGIGAFFAADIALLQGVFTAMKQGIQGNFSDALNTLQSMGSTVASVVSEYGSDLSGIFSEQTLGQKLRDRMSELRGVAAVAKDAKQALDFDANGDAKLDKEAQAYAALISQIKSKIQESKLALVINDQLTEGQKIAIKVEQELASGKLVLSDAHQKVIQSKLAELAATENLIKAQAIEKDVLNWIIESTRARLASRDALEIEYAMYGKSNASREVAMIAIREEAEMEKFLSAERKAGKSITEEQLDQLRRETDLRIATMQATLAQTKALQGAATLAEKNKTFNAEWIIDDEARAQVQLQLEAEKWQEMIQLAGDGTDAQKKLQKEYDQWYANESMRPALQKQKDLWKSIEGVAHDTFISILQSGKSAFDRLRDALKNGLYELLYQMTLKQWILNIQGNVSSVPGALQAVGSAGSALAAAGSLSGLLNLGGAAGTALNSSVVGQFYSGLTGSAGAAAQAMGAEMTTAASIGNTVATVFQSLGGWTTVAGVVGAWLISNWLDKGPEANTRLTFANNNKPGNISINERGNEGQTSNPYIGGYGTSALGTFGVSSSFWMDTTSKAMQDFIKTVSQTDDVLARLMTTTEQASVKDYLTGKSYYASTGAEGSNPNANGQLDKVFAQRLANILDGVESGLSDAIKSFVGTSQEAATEAAKILAARHNLDLNSKSVFGEQVSLQQIMALRGSSEATSAALDRVVQEFQLTDAAAKMLGKTTVEAYGKAGFASVQAREEFIAAAGGMDALTAKVGAYNTAMATLTSAQSAYNSAVQAARSAMSTAAGQYMNFVNAVTAAQSGVADARAAISEQYLAAVQAERDARKTVIDEQTRITDGYLQAADKVAQARQKIGDSFSKLANDLGEFLSSLETTDLAGASSASQYAALQSQFAVMGAAAKAGDAYAASRLPTIATNLLKASKDQASTSLEFQRDVALVRNTVGAALNYANGRATAANPNGTPDELGAALAEQAKWAEAVTKSGASFERSTTSILAGYDAAVAAQKDAAGAVAYWATVARDTGASTDLTKSALQTQGEALIAQYLAAQNALAKAQIELEAANKIKGDLELKQTTALEEFATSIKNVNSTAADAYAKASELFTAASNELLAGSAAAAAAQVEAKSGMTYWGSVVTSTAAGIAASVAALAGVQAQVQAAAAANAAAIKATGTEALVRSWYAGNWQYGDGSKPDAGGVAYWMDKLKQYGMDTVKSGFAEAAARDAGYTTPLSIKTFATGGDFGGGLRIVGENGPELEATGPSRIFNAGQTRQILSGGTQELEKRIDQVVAENKRLNTQMTSLLAFVAKQTKMIERVTNNGQAMTVTTDSDNPLLTETA
ncbi:hypothetical protein [Massilia sp. TS11]|uniref:hypothetical protein n=1 Tax=Massilia sp. TS11 TaxID=2908003 RepID=UPI001EDC685D|nr:hypothetical protein [Massilia sp. TS11]MCG2585516.1 hypothetical protein [Massilia sp. TS11]